MILDADLWPEVVEVARDEILTDGDEMVHIDV